MTEARKLYSRVMLRAGSENRTPHSLGKCIEWKQHYEFSIIYYLHILSPHSLGKCIEWKPDRLLTGTVQSNNLFHSPLAGEMY